MCFICVLYWRCLYWNVVLDAISGCCIGGVVLRCGIRCVCVGDVCVGCLCVGDAVSCVLYVCACIGGVCRGGVWGKHAS